MGDCKKTVLAQYASEEPCELISSDCIIYQDSVAYLSLEQNTPLTEVLQAYLNSLMNVRTRVQTLENRFNQTNTYTFSNLPSNPVTGQLATITDADNVSYRADAIGGGTEKALVFYEGTKWIYH